MEDSMPKPQQLILSASMIVILCCSSVQVSQDYDPETDFAKLKTFDWQSETQQKTGDVRVDDQLIDSRIRKATERAFTTKGYQRVTQMTPDFYISYQYVIQQKIKTDNVRTGIGIGYGSRGRYGGIGVSSGADVSSYDEGLLVIDVIDSGSGKLLWRGKATRSVSSHSDPEKTTQAVNEAVEKILNQFPPLPKK
jgi:hypothetical protein